VELRSFKEDPKRLGRTFFGAVFLAIFIGYYFMASAMPSGSMESPGAGLFPGWIGIAGIAISLIVIGEAVIGRSESGEIAFPKGNDLKNLVVFFGMLVLYVLLLPVLGIYIGSILFGIAFLRIVGDVAWLRSIIIGGLMGFVLPFFFDAVLGLRLPTGMIL